MQISVHLLKKTGGLDPGLANDCGHFFASFVFSLFISETPNPLHIMDFVPWSMKRQICVHSRFRFFSFSQALDLTYLKQITKYQEYTLV